MTQLVRWSPLESLLTPLDREFFSGLDRFAADLVGQRRGLGQWRPAVDIRDTEDNIVLSLELPGVDPSQVAIEVDQNVLTVSGSRQSQMEKEEAGYQRRERFYGSFTRSFALPEGIDDSLIRADYAHGVLEITVPKPAKTQPRQIAIAGVLKADEVEEAEAVETVDGEIRESAATS